jgi:hypothetical protein
MSGKKPATTRKTKAAAAKEAAAAAAPVVAAPVAAPAPVVPLVTPPAVVAVVPKVKKPVPDGHIDAHRVRKSIQQIINESVFEQSAPLQPEVTAYKRATEALAKGTIEVDGATPDAPKVTRALTDAEKAEYNNTVKKLTPGHAERVRTLALLKSAKLRISPEVSTLFKYVLEQIVRQGSKPALDTAAAEGRKKATVGHFHTDKVNALQVFPLLQRSATFRNTNAQLRAEREAAEHADQIKAHAKQAVNDFKRAYGYSQPRGKKQAEPAPAAAAEAPAAEKPAIVKTPQSGSIDGLAKEIARDYGVAGMSLSGELRRHFGDIINDLIVEFSGIMLNLVVKAGNKTITDSIAYSALSLVYTQGCRPSNKIELVDGQVRDPVKVAEEKKKKADAKAANKPYKINYDLIPMVTGKVVKQTVTFPTSQWEPLRVQLEAYLAGENERIEAEKKDRAAKRAAAGKK